MKICSLVLVFVDRNLFYLSFIKLSLVTPYGWCNKLCLFEFVHGMCRCNKYCFVKVCFSSNRRRDRRLVQWVPLSRRTKVSRRKNRRNPNNKLVYQSLHGLQQTKLRCPLPLPVITGAD